MDEGLAGAEARRRVPERLEAAFEATVLCQENAREAAGEDAVDRGGGKEDGAVGDDRLERVDWCDGEALAFVPHFEALAGDAQ